MNIKQILLNSLKETFLHLSYEFDDLTLSFSSREGADFQCNSAFAIAKKMHTSPEVVANAIASNLKQDVADVSVAKPGFINFKIKDEAFSKMLCEALADDRLALPKLENTQKIVMDYGGANVAKELHIGHLRSPVIGESLARLNKILGNEVITDTHLGDWGLQMGLTIAQLEDDGYVDGYFDKTKKNKEITLDTLNEEYPKASSRKNNDEEFRKILNSSCLNIPDGYGIVWASKELKCPLSERVTGFDFIHKIFELGQNMDISFYFLGSKPGIAELAKQKIEEDYFGISVIGTHDGYFSVEDEKKIIKEINALNPDILLVAMGAPKQERFIYKYRDKLNCKVAIGVGGCFDVISGNVKRAPDIFIKFHLEWLYRALTDFRRFKRLIAIPKFMGQVKKYKRKMKV